MANSHEDRPSGSRFAAVVLLLVPVIGFAFFGSRHEETATSFPPEIRDTVNPNTAPLEELVVLPRIGESLARAVILHRRQEGRNPTSAADRVFHSATDLLPVRGIGPKTVAKIQHELHFDDSP